MVEIAPNYKSGGGLGESHEFVSAQIFALSFIQLQVEIEKRIANYFSKSAV